MSVVGNTHRRPRRPRRRAIAVRRLPLLLLRRWWRRLLRPQFDVVSVCVPTPLMMLLWRTCAESDSQGARTGGSSAAELGAGVWPEALTKLALEEDGATDWAPMALTGVAAPM